VLENAQITNRANGDKVAVIGSGPAGLSAAFNLVQQGYQVTVFEKDQKPGSLLQYAIPAFRLSDKVIASLISYYRKMAIEFRTGISLGKDISTAELSAHLISQKNQ
jgi:NADPH-dependent glutamate synthase beta subunit-like oxidoreductase